MLYISIFCIPFAINSIKCHSAMFQIADMAEKTTRKPLITPKEVKCILHIGPKSDEKIKTFCEDTIRRVLYITEQRRKYFPYSKYIKVCDSLPNVISKEHGYHRTCYKNFTAIPTITDEFENRNEPCDEPVLLRSSVDHPSVSSSGVFEPTCAICNKESKGRAKEKLGTCQAFTAETNIKKSAETLNDSTMIAKVGQVDFVAKEVKYHHTCRRKYLNDADAYKKKAASASVTKEETSYEINESTSNSIDYIAKAAREIRAEILKLKNECEKLPTNLTPADIVRGQADPPTCLVKLFSIMYTGHEDESKYSERAKRMITSSAHDAVFATTRGVVKPAKQLLTGMAIKSMTGSKKLVNTLNHFNQCTSYTVTEELEADLAETITKRNVATPDGIVCNNKLCTSLAWDNFDKNTETLSGHNTLHATFGICYQNELDVQDECVKIPVVRGGLQSSQKHGKRKHTLSDGTDLEPYMKKPHINTFDYGMKELQVTPKSVDVAKLRDTAWAFSCALLEDTPMWVGWNALITAESLPKQRVKYMESISFPPTRLDVVQETMKMSQALAKECGQEFIVVTYDLAIAKPALLIQAQDAPKFDNIFVCFGAFHIQMAFFSVLGHILDGSGGDDILVDTDVLASGSMNGFLAGKHFNRCKRLHPLLATAFKVLHIRKFISSHERYPVVLEQRLQELQTNIGIADVLMNELEESPVFQGYMAEYEKFAHDTRSGRHGATAAFWMLYGDLVELYLLFSRATRMNDLDLFIYCLGKMAPLFFATSHPNYARWMVRYYLNLMNVNETHPGVREMLEDGALSVGRTGRRFSRVPVDLALEQTINADAASKLTGISSMSASDAAMKKWMITRSARTEIVNAFLTMAGVKINDDSTHELNQSRVKKDNSDLNKVINGIEMAMNPFMENVADDNLYCISNGHALSENIKADLLQCNETGVKWCDEFTDGCFNDPERFEKPIKRRKVRNFASEAITVKVMAKDMKIKQLQGTRDLFGRLLYLATTSELDLASIFTYPLTPIPLSLAHVDGSINKTDKSKLMHLLEDKIHTSAPGHVDVYLVDAMCIIQAITKNIPRTYGGIALLILRRICSLADTILFVCDSYDSHSVKDIEHAKRGESDVDIKITGSEQKRPNDFHRALRSSRYKTEFLSFLQREWSRPRYATVLGKTEVFFCFDKAYKIYQQNNEVKQVVLSSHKSSHVEADTRIMFHLDEICESQDHLRLVVRSVDTDILIILLYHIRRYWLHHVWMDVGHSYNNTRRYIDITALADKLGAETCEALPAIHAFSGSDYTAAFYRKGKKRIYELAHKVEGALDAFAMIGETAHVNIEDVPELESLVCILYSKASCSSVNEARFLTFQAKYAPANKKKPLEKIMGADASMLPPCMKVLEQKVKRANYISYMWKHAHLANPTKDLNPCESGWLLVDDRYALKWFEGEQIPQNVAVSIDDNFFDSDNDYTDDSGDESENGD